MDTNTTSTSEIPKFMVHEIPIGFAMAARCLFYAAIGKPVKMAAKLEFYGNAVISLVEVRTDK